MALIEPFINNISAFDALAGTNLNINVLGGDSITDYQFSLYYNDNTDIPFFISPKYSVLNDIENGSIRTFSINIVPNISGTDANGNLITLTLNNNFQYRIRPTIFNGEKSISGNYTLFSCYKSPSVSLYYKTMVNGDSEYVLLENGTTLPLANPNIRITFNPNDLQSSAQPNIASLTLIGITDEEVEEEIGNESNLYNFSHNTITDDYNLDVQLSGFTINVDKDGNLLSKNSRLYKSFTIKYTVTTLENFKIDGKITGVNCYYNTLRNSPYITVDNICDEGIIRITCSLTSINGTSNPDPAIYTDSGTEIDLTGPDSWVQWQRYFALEEPYTLRLWARNLQIGPVLTMSLSIANHKYIKISYNEKEDYAFMSLECGQPNSTGDAMFPYYIESDKILLADITSETKLFIGIQQQGGLFDIDFRIL